MVVAVVVLGLGFLLLMPSRADYVKDELAAVVQLVCGLSVCRQLLTLDSDEHSHPQHTHTHTAPPQAH